MVRAPGGSISRGTIQQRVTRDGEVAGGWFVPPGRRPSFRARPVRGQQARLRCQRRRGYRPSPRPRRGRRPHSPGSKTRGDEPHRVAHPGGVPQPVSSASGLCDPFGVGWNGGSCPRGLRPRASASSTPPASSPHRGPCSGLYGGGRRGMDSCFSDEGRRMVLQGRRILLQGRRMFLQGRRMFLQGRRMFLQGRRMFLQGRRILLQGRRMPLQGCGNLLQAPLAPGCACRPLPSRTKRGRARALHTVQPFSCRT